MTKLKSDMHVHSDYSSCHATMQEVVWDAILNQYSQIGINDHYDKIIENSTFFKYHEEITNTARNAKSIIVKRGVEFDLKDRELVLNDLKKIQNDLDYISCHDLKSFESLQEAKELSKKSKIPLVVAHPEVGYWDTSNEEILTFLKKNDLTVEANRTHFSYLKGESLQKTDDFFDLIISTPKIKVSFGSDYHGYGQFETKNALFEKIWNAIPNERIFMSVKSKPKGDAAEKRMAAEWYSTILSGKKSDYINTGIANNPVLQLKQKIIRTQTIDVFKFIRSTNNTGLNMFIFDKLVRMADKTGKNKEACQLLQTKMNDPLKDIRRHTHESFDKILTKNPALIPNYLPALQKRIIIEKNGALKKKLENMVKKLQELEK